MNRLRGALADLAVLASLIRHRKRWWRAWRSLADELFREGGATIDSTAGGGHDGEQGDIVLRTLIQPDGDVLVLVRAGPLLDDELLAGHRRRVEEWYEGNRTAVHQAAGALRALVATGSLAAAGASGWGVTEPVALDGAGRALAGLAVSAVVLPCARYALSRSAERLLRSQINRWLGSLGTAG